MHSRLSEIAASRVHLSSEEAVALVLAAAEDSDGTSRTGSRLADAERVEDLARLLHTLLRLDERIGEGRPHVPGALLVLIARATGQMDLPPLSFLTFTNALRRFGSPDPGTLASIQRRVIRHSSASGGPHLPTRTWFSRVTLRAAVAAALALAALGLAVERAVPDRAPSVRIVQARATVKAPPAAAGVQGPSSTAPVKQPRTTPALLVSPAAAGIELFSPSFTGNGRELLVHAGRSRSALVRVSFDDTGRPALATLLHDGAANYHATQSPDGRWLAYDSDRDGTRGVYVARADASGARKVSGAGYAAVPKWSPDGRRLAFIKAENRRPRVWNVWIADLTAGTLSRVSRHAVGQAWGASWFPDGRRLAYSVEDRLVIADLTSGTTRVVRSPRRRGLVRTPAVSPDGRWIVFQVHRDGGWLLDVATGRMRRVLDDATAEEFAWSPDSRRLIYHTQRHGNWSVWQFALDPAA
jgi:Tol biopolymer transport system component